MFTVNTTSDKNFDGRSRLQQALDRESVRTQSQEVGLDDAGAVSFDDQLDPAAPIFRRGVRTPRLFEVDFCGEWARA